LAEKTREQRWLAELLARLPAADCAGCHQCASRCAGEINMTRTEYERIHEFLGGCAPFTSVRKRSEMAKPCGFRDPEGDGCVVYPVRPLICRLFGVVQWLPCPIAAVPVLVPDGVELMRQYMTFERRTYRQWQRELTATQSTRGEPRRRR